MSTTKTKKVGNSRVDLVPNTFTLTNNVNDKNIVKNKRLDFYGIYKGYPKYQKEEDDKEREF